MSAVPAQPIMRAMTHVLLADVEGPARRSVAELLRLLDGVELIGEAGNRAELDAALRHTGADVLVIDERLLRHGHTLPAGVRVIVLGIDDHPAFAGRARALGADTWLLKDRAGEDLPIVLGVP